MAEPLELHPTPTRLALLADVAAGKVIDDPDEFAPYLHHDEGRSRVADAIWELERAGWVQQVRMDHVWTVSIVGVDVLEGRTDG